MKKIIFFIIFVLFIFLNSKMQTNDPCGHLTGVLYDGCHTLDVKGR